MQYSTCIGQHRKSTWWLICCLMYLTWFVSPSTNAQTTANPKSESSRSALPDIVFILSDDQAYSDYSFMGHAHIQTPNLDKLAKESRLFTRGYVPDSLCRPSLASIITGLYPHQHGIVGNDPPPEGGWSSSSPRKYTDKQYQGQIQKYLQAHIDRLETLPDRLKPLGYRSLQTGKWWEGHPERGGFDVAMTHGDHSRGGRHGDKGLEIGRKTMQPIVDFVKQARQDNQPYFLWYAPMLPHTPHDPPARLLEKYKPLAPTEPIAKYWAMCELFDETIGQLRSIIDEHGHPENTLVVYVTDNGWINLPDKSAYAPRSKRSPNEGGIRTPIMFSWPGHLEPSRDDQSLVSSVDLVPTTLAIVNSVISSSASDKALSTKGLPGINALDDSQRKQRTAVYGGIFEHDIVDLEKPDPSLMDRWIIDGYHKVIVPAKRLTGEKIQLYDLKQDPQENQDLANTQEGRAIVARLHTKLDTWWKPVE